MKKNECKTLIFKVMKQKIFTLMMVVGLIALANTTFAQNEATVTAGGTYNYSLSGVKVQTAAGSTATVSYAEGSITATEFGGTPFINGGALPNNTSAALTFTIEFDDDALTGQAITVTVVDGGTGKCSNSIQYTITVEPAPTIDLTASTTSTSKCQEKGTASTDGTSSAADNAAVSANTITIGVASVVSDEPLAFTATASISITGLTNLENVSVVYTAGNGESWSGGTGTTGTITWDETSTSTGDFTGSFAITFNTTEGIADQNVNVAITSVSITETGGGEQYDETATADNVLAADIVVYSMPTIGSF